jgi:thioredoxin-like negative regulator of GroEL
MSADRARCAFRRFFAGKSTARLAVLLAVAVFSNAAEAAPIVWHKDIRAALRASAEQGKPLMVMVGAGWCGYCHKMLQQTFPDPALALRVNGQFVPVLLDADEQAELVQKLRVDAMPTVLVISPERRILGRFAGFQSAAQLAARLASFQRARPAPAPAPKAVESKPSFHERAWAAIQAAAPRDTLEAAREFSASR